MTARDAPAMTVVVCGGGSSSCQCRCPDACDHDWSLWKVHADGRGATAQCSRCLMTAMEHDRWVMP